MNDLRLIGMHGNGTHLLLAGPEGQNYRLPITDDLQNAVVDATSADTDNRSVEPQKTPADEAASPTGTPSPNAAQGEGSFKETPRKPISPKDIQSRIRAGENSAAIAAATGTSLAFIQKFEGPVLAERQYIVEQAHSFALPRQHQSLFDQTTSEQDAQPTLGEVTDRSLSELGYDSDQVEWDAYRRHDNKWIVTLQAADQQNNTSARWLFEPRAKILTALDATANELTREKRIEDGPLPASRHTAVRAVVGDKPATPSSHSSDPQPVEPVEAETDNSAQLLDTLADRRGRRIKTEELSAASLQSEAAGSPDSSATKESSPDTPVSNGSVVDAGNRFTPNPATENITVEDSPGLSVVEKTVHPVVEQSVETQPVTPTDDHSIEKTPSSQTSQTTEGKPHEQQNSPGSADEQESVTAENRETSPEEQPDQGLFAAEPPTEPSTGSDEKTSNSKKSKRPNLPSWDEIFFGNKPQ